VPVLARGLESLGLSTVIVTNMPYWSEKMGAPRTIGVEFPFGHPLGMPGDRETQMRIIREALRLLDEAREPGEVRELEIEWPQPFDEAKRDWQPAEPSPIVKMMLEQRAKAAQERQEGA
jgi:D-proline reductase (dithiol) PrdB